MKIAVANMRPENGLLFMYYVKKYFRNKRRRRKKLTTLLINHFLYSFEMRKFISLAEINMLYTTMEKAPRSIWALQRSETWFEDLWDNRLNPEYTTRLKEDF